MLYDSATPPSQRSASEVAYADAPDPVKLPGRMYTVTLYDKRGNQVGTTLTEPLFEDIDGDLFFGEVGPDGQVHWKDEGVELEFSLRVGAKLDDDGSPRGGIPVEKWARQVGKQNLGSILIQIDGATAKVAETPPLYALDDSGKQDARPTSNGTIATRQGDSPEKPATGSRTTSAGGESDRGNGGPSQAARAGTTAERGHRGPSTASEPTRGGDAASGSKRGTAGAKRDGSSNGIDFGDDYDANYFYDPSKADVGGDVLAPEAADVGGMVGGKPHSTDEGIPQGGWFELVSVPRNVAPAVAAGIILLDADLAGLGADIFKASLKLGRKAAGKAGALSKVITKKLESFTARETAKLAETLSQDAAFASKSVSEQAAILSEARAGIADEANRRLRADLEARVAEHKALAATDAKRTDGFAEEFVEQETANARAAQDALDSLPEVADAAKPVAADASKVESPALNKSPYHPDSVAERVRPPYEPNPAHDPDSALYNPHKTPEPPDAADVYARSMRGKMGTWFGKGEEGWYQFFYDRNQVVHFSGVIPEHRVPIDIRKASEQ